MLTWASDGPLVGFGCCHTFEFDRDHPGVMKMPKTMPSDTNYIEVTMLRGEVTAQVIWDAYQVMPPVITPTGLSLQRSLYLYKMVREYVVI